MRLVLSFLLIQFVALGTGDAVGQTVGAQKNIQGEWQGTAITQAGRVRIVVKVSRLSDGTYRATMDSPDQHAIDVPIDSFVCNDSFVRFDMKDSELTFEGGL